MKNILIIGNNVHSYILSLILLKNVDCNVVIFDDKKSKKIFNDYSINLELFCEKTGINQYSLIKNCNASYKSGTVFNNFTEEPFMHNINDFFSERISSHRVTYKNLISKNIKSLFPRADWENKIKMDKILDPNTYKYKNCHIDTILFQNYLLEKLKKEKKFSIINGKIKINKGFNGKYLYQIGKWQHEADYIIDSTINKKIFNIFSDKKENYAEDYIFYSDFFIENNKEVNLWTSLNLIENSYLMSIPLYDRNVNRVFFKSKKEFKKAKKEIVDAFNQKIKFSKKDKINTYCNIRNLQNNVLLFGPESSTTIPIFFSNLDISILLSSLFCDLLNGEIDENNLNEIIFVNTRSIFNLNNILFNKNIEPDEETKYLLKTWNKRLPFKEEVVHKMDKYAMINDSHFIVLMAMLNLFDIDSISTDYEKTLQKTPEYDEEKIINFFKNELESRFMGHRDYLNEIKFFSI